MVKYLINIYFFSLSSNKFLLIRIVAATSATDLSLPAIIASWRVPVVISIHIILSIVIVITTTAIVVVIFCLRYNATFCITLIIVIRILLVRPTIMMIEHGNFGVVIAILLIVTITNTIWYISIGVIHSTWNAIILIIQIERLVLLKIVIPGTQRPQLPVAH